jgi:hypothetical protein
MSALSPHPALSLGEKGNCFRSLGKSTADFCPVALNNKDVSNGCSLSPRETVRVRGNRVAELPTPLVDSRKHPPADIQFFKPL